MKRIRGWGRNRRKVTGEEGTLEALTEMTTCGRRWKPPQWRGPR